VAGSFEPSFGFQNWRKFAEYPLKTDSAPWRYYVGLISDSCSFLQTFPSVANVLFDIHKFSKALQLPVRWVKKWYYKGK
jgi:hypothetical protein